MGQLNTILPFLLMFVVIYFFMIRPQQTKIKKEDWKYAKEPTEGKYYIIRWVSS